MLSMSEIANAQQEDHDTKNIFSFSGGLDMYYRFNFNDAKNASYTSFTRTPNSFELGMASVRADHNFGKVSATIDLGFGSRAEEFAYNDAGTRLALKQAYLTYSPGAAVKLTAGSWATHVGYEMLDPWLNRNYSMSYMFTNGPFTHTGVKADIVLSGKNSLMVGISNPTDYRSAPGMPKSFIAQFATATPGDKLKLYLNLVAGKQNDYRKTVQGDVVASFSASSQFGAGINATFQANKLDVDSSGNFRSLNWGGTALYLNYDPSKWVGLTFRGEYIVDDDGYLGIDRAFTPTVSANFRVDNLTIIPEFSASPATTFIIAAVYHFSRDTEQE